MPKASYSIVTKLMLAALGELPCLRHPDTDFILQDEATALRNRQEFQRSQLTELASTDFESWQSKRRQEGFNLRLRSFDPGGADRRGVAR